MKKTSLTLVICLLMGHCFGQTVNNNDSASSAQSAKRQQLHDSLQSASRANLSIYPNPAKNKVTLQVKGFNAGTVLVKILDPKGKLIREDKRLLTNGDEEIVMFLMLPPGIYFVIVSEKGKVARKKLLMQ